MVKVTKKWVLKYVKTAYRNGEPFNFKNIKATEFNTILDARNVKEVENKTYRQMFEILVPNLGWVEAFPLM